MLVMKSRILGRERSRKESVETLYSVIHLSVLVIHTRVFTPPSGLLGQISASAHRPLLLFNAWSKFLRAAGETLRLCYLSVSSNQDRTTTLPQRPYRQL